MPLSDAGAARALRGLGGALPPPCADVAAAAAAAAAGGGGGARVAGAVWGVEDSAGATAALHMAQARSAAALSNVQAGQLHGFPAEAAEVVVGAVAVAVCPECV
jgi:hypothetical protein